ncbi:hypothetical protein [Natronomonas amylolytica]|uniref:hypothetical protein n=1 Tax=Natronomonas amylolytica TaxID=3108498 RepID=UPI00300BB51E
MPSTRRSVLLGTASALVALAGCNETTSDDYPTVTPVDVPRTKAEALQEAAELDRPEIPGAVRVTDDHLEAAIEDTERLIADLRSALDRGEDLDLQELGRRLQHEPEGLPERAETQLESAREAGPSEGALSTIERAVRDVALAVGYLEARLGDVDRAGIEAALDTEAAATEALIDDFSYRVADPLVEHLPTLRAAEASLDRLDDLDRARAPLDEADPERDELDIAIGFARRELEVHRRNRRDAERLMQTATDGNRPSLRPAIDDVSSGLRGEVESIVETYADRDPPSGASIEGELRGIRIHVGRRGQQWLSREAERDAERVGPLGQLLDMTAWLVEFAALDVAVTRTTDRLDGGEMPTDAIVAAKRDAIEALERAAEGDALQRELAARGGILVRSADRSATAGDDARTVARTHLLYAAADEWGRRALDRGSDLAARLQAQQS